MIKKWLSKKWNNVIDSLQEKSPSELKELYSGDARDMYIEIILKQLKMLPENWQIHTNDSIIYREHIIDVHGSVYRKLNKQPLIFESQRLRKAVIKGGWFVQM